MKRVMRPRALNESLFEYADLIAQAPRFTQPYARQSKLVKLFQRQHVALNVHLVRYVSRRGIGQRWETRG